MLSGRGLCDELITRPEDSYRLWCVVVYVLETSRIGAPYIYDISNLRVKVIVQRGRRAHPVSHQRVTVIILYPGKAVPVQTFTGPQDSKSLRLPDFYTIRI